ncbi:hypothetical protein HY409_02575 [Candidatus Gottesmanbacteria bacterium]|nr:hypothetical protein [Candidatus Gottesmanbacteria bacterium]
MTITPKTIAVTILTGSIIYFLWTLSSSQQAKTVQNAPSKLLNNSYQTQESSEASVTVSVAPRVLFIDERPVFDVIFETHSVELAFDVAEVTTLVDQNGNDLGKSSWNGSSPGGHHRNGTLSFAKPLPKSTQRVILTLKDIAGIAKRTYTWEVKRS